MTIDLSRPWNECALVVVDFETDGPDQETCMPVELAAVRFEAGNVTARFSTFLNPGRPIDPASTKIHGIDDAMVQGAPTLEQVAGEILKVAVDAVPAAYNSRFDARVLHRFITGNDAPVFDPEQEWLCGFVMAGSEKQDRWVPGKGRLRLTEVAKRHGISVGTAHRAEADAVAAGKLIYHFMGDKKPTMEKVLERMRDARLEQVREHEAFRKRCRDADRVIWRQYAVAALNTVERMARDDMVPYVSRYAASVADDLLALEKERFQ